MVPYHIITMRFMDLCCATLLRSGKEQLQSLKVASFLFIQKKPPECSINTKWEGVQSE